MLGKPDRLELLELVFSFENHLRGDEPFGADAFEPGDLAANDIQLGRRPEEVCLRLHELLVREANFEQRLVGYDRLPDGHEDFRKEAGHGRDRRIPGPTGPLHDHAGNRDRAVKRRYGDCTFQEPDAFSGLLGKFDRVFLRVPRVAVIVSCVPLVTGPAFMLLRRRRCGARGHAPHQANDLVAHGRDQSHDQDGTDHDGSKHDSKDASEGTRG